MSKTGTAIIPEILKGGDYGMSIHYFGIKKAQPGTI